MAKLDAVMHEHGHEHVVARLELGIGVDIDNVDVRPELSRERRERGEHVVAKMAPGPPVKRQPRATRTRAALTRAALIARHF